MNAPKSKIAILISGRGSNMEAIIKASQEVDFPAEVALVISNKDDAKGIDVAKSYGIKTQTIAHKDFTNKVDFETALCESLEAVQPDLICLAGFMRIFGDTYFERVKTPTLNIHPSLLPKHKGLNTHQAAIDAGDISHGVSVHFVTPALDDGAIIMQESIEIHKGDTANDLANRLLPIEHEIYPKAIRKVLNT